MFVSCCFRCSLKLLTLSDKHHFFNIGSELPLNIKCFKCHYFILLDDKQTIVFVVYVLTHLIFKTYAWQRLLFIQNMLFNLIWVILQTLTYRLVQHFIFILAISYVFQTVSSIEICPLISGKLAPYSSNKSTT